MSIYTGNGDKGLTSTIKYTDISKSHPVFEILGTIDELMSALGLAVIVANTDTAADLNRIQQKLINIASDIAGGFPAEVEDDIHFMENKTDEYEKLGIAPTTFKVKGNSEAGARVDMARAIARRLERTAVVPHGDDRLSNELIVFFNRLSDYLFMTARYLDFYESLAGKVKERVGDTEMANTEQETQTGKLANANVGMSASASAGAASLGLTHGGESISVQTAKALCEAVLELGRQMGIRVVAAIVDNGGNTISVLRDDDAYIASVAIATDKAWTSVVLKMTTEEVKNLTKEGADLMGLEATNSGRIVNFGGGIPLKLHGKIIGGLGVSGGSAEQDTELVNAGGKVFEELKERTGY